MPVYLSADSVIHANYRQVRTNAAEAVQLLWFHLTASHNCRLSDSRLPPFIRSLVAFYSYCYETASIAFTIPALDSSDICNCCVWHLCILALSVETTKQWQLEVVNNFLNALYNNHQDFLSKLTSRNHSKRRRCSTEKCWRRVTCMINLDSTLVTTSRRWHSRVSCE